MRSYLTDIPPIFLIMRSFKTSKVELIQLDPTPGFRLATPMEGDCECSLALRYLFGRYRPLRGQRCGLHWQLLLHFVYLIAR